MNRHALPVSPLGCSAIGYYGSIYIREGISALNSSLYDQIRSEEEQHSESTNQAKIISVLDSMPEDDRDSIVKALHDSSMNMKVICSVMNRNGYEISYDQIRRFRNGEIRIPERYRL